MCIIIDTNTLPAVFNSKNTEHQKFKPVFDWIINKTGRMVYGGTKYEKELEKLFSYLKLIRFLKECYKVIVVDKDSVDQNERLLLKGKKSKQFNDCHLIVIVIVSRCRIICSNDRKSFRFLKDSSLYPASIRPPSIYSKSSNSPLLLMTCRNCRNHSYCKNRLVNRNLLKASLPF